jgi:hypothetical protein
VAISYPTPTYPADCERMRIQGTVEVSIWVQNGKMVKVKGASANPLLAGKSARWIHRNRHSSPAPLVCTSFRLFTSSENQQLTVNRIDFVWDAKNKAPFRIYLSGALAI